MSLILQDQLTLSTKTKEQVEKNTQDIAKNTQDIQDLEDKLAVVYKFKGSVDTYADLPTENNQTGDVWDVKADDMNYAWTADGEWDQLGPTVDLSGYVPTSRTINNKPLESDITLEPSDIGAATAAQGELADTALQSEDLKTINGTSIVGEGDIVITTNYSFKDTWTTDSTTNTFLNDVYTDEDAIPGMTYLGELTCSDLPTGLNNAEALVEVMPSATVAEKVIHVVITSGNLSPYRWELTYWVIGSTPHNSGWIAFQPQITSSNKLNSDLVTDANQTNKFVTASEKTTWSGKQDALVSGTNIKTVNNTSLLGEGNITIDSLPSQAGNADKFLTTDGTDASWAELNITNKFLTGVADPTSSTAAEFVGQLYRNTTTKTEWTCDDPRAIISTSGQNWVTTGTLTVSDGIISGFSTSNYCETNVNIPESYIFITRFIDDSPTSYSGYLGNKNNLTYGLKHGVGSDPRFFLQGPDGSAGNNTKALTWTWVKIVYTSSEKKMYWIEDNNYTMSTVPWGTGFDISSAGAVFNSAHLVFGRSQAGSIISCSARFDFKNTIIYQADGTTEVWTPFINVYGSLWTQLANQSEVNKKLENTATGSNLTIGSTSATTANNAYGNINIGASSQIITGSTQIQGAIAIGQSSRASASNSTALGRLSRATGPQSIAIGLNANAAAEEAYQIGRGENTNTRTLQVGFWDPVNERDVQYQLLDSSGKVPTGRYIVMTGADGTNAGTIGAVPAPTATDNTKFLKGDGTWAEIDTNITLDDIALAGNNIEFSNIAENFSIHGTPTVENRVFSDFSANNYLTTSNFLNVNNIESFEVITAFKYIDQTANYTKYKCILEANDSINKGLRFSLTNEEQRRLFYRIEDATNGLNGLEIRLYGTSEIVSGTKYYSKITYNNTDGYKVYLSDDDGETWTLEAEDSATDLPLQTAGDFAIGQNYAHNTFNCFEGEIYLDEWEAYVNENLVWVPYEEVDRTVISSIIPKSYLSNMAAEQTSLAILGVATSQVTSGTCVGKNSYTLSGSTAIGAYANGSSTNAVAVGNLSRTYGSNGIAIGYNSQITGSNAIQIGTGTNSDAGTLSIGLGNDSNYQLLNTNGQVPADRYITMTGADGTTAGTKGVVPAPAATDNNKFLKGDGTWAEAAAQPTYDANTKTITF